MRRFTRVATALALALGALACSDYVGPEDEEGLQLQLSVVGPLGVSAAEIAALGDAFDQVDSYVVTIVQAGSLEPVASATIQITPGGTVHVLDVEVPEESLGSSVQITLVAYDGATELYRSTTVVTLGNEVATIPVDLEIRYTGPGIRGTIVDDQGVPVGGALVELFQGQGVAATVNTEPDGTYLFLNVAAGLYQIVPFSQTGVFCPSQREVDVTGVSDAFVANFQSALSCTVDVLVMSGGDVDDTDLVASVLANDPNLNISTFYYLNQLPGATYLNQFDVVLLFQNGLFDESGTLGSEVKDYVDAGGNVVTASFYWQGRNDSGLGSIGWGMLETIDPFTSTGGTNYSSQDMDGQSIVPHPLTQNVAFVGTTSYWGGAAAKTGTQVVAAWLDGSPFIGYRILPGGQRLAAVSLFPGAVQESFGDVQAVWENAVNWAGSAGGPG